MIGKSKKLLGIVCFTIAVNLFGIIWLLHDQKIIVKQMEQQGSSIQVTELLRLHKVKTIKLLCGIYENLALGNIKKYQENCAKLKEFLPNFNVSMHWSDKQIVERFDANKWLYVQRNTMLRKVSHVYTNMLQNRSMIIQEVSSHLARSEFGQAAAKLSKINTVNLLPECIKWYEQLIYAISIKRMIRKAIVILAN